MDDINALLSSLTPEDMQTLQSVASQLLGSMNQSGANQQPAAQPEPPPNPQGNPDQQAGQSGGANQMAQTLANALAAMGGANQPNPVQNNAAGQTPDLGALLGSLGLGGGSGQQQEQPQSLTQQLGIDPAMIAKMAGIMKHLNTTDDKRVQFLNALKPMLSSARQKRADEAMKMLKLFELLPVLREQGLFNLL